MHSKVDGSIGESDFRFIVPFQRGRDNKLLTVAGVATMLPGLPGFPPWQSENRFAWSAEENGHPPSGDAAGWSM
jgi:hypothetical protein